MPGDGEDELLDVGAGGAEVRQDLAELGLGPLRDGDGHVVGEQVPLTNAWYTVATSTPVTVTDAIPESPTASARVSTVVTADAYRVVEMAALVIYAHHASENRTPLKKLIRTTCTCFHRQRLNLQICNGVSASAAARTRTSDM